MPSLKTGKPKSDDGLSPTPVNPTLPWFYLSILYLISVSGNLDYSIAAALLAPIKREFDVTDGMLGLLGGLTFVISFPVASLPLARWADRGNRRYLIVLSLAVWSVMTIVGGLSRSFWYLVASRFCVGAAEAGVWPASQSLIADYFSFERRSRAMSLWVTSASVGSFAGMAIGGYIASTWGWRAALLAVGFPGLLLAALAWIFLDEPRKRPNHQAHSAEAEAFVSALCALWNKSSFRYLAAGASMLFFFTYGVATFLPLYMVRTFSLSFTSAGLLAGTILGISGIVGSPTGGWLAAKLAERGPRVCAILMAVSCGLGAVGYVVALRVQNLHAFVTAALLGNISFAITAVLIWPALHLVCGSVRRATAVSVLQSAYVMIGAGFGPLVAGILSDSFERHFAGSGLRYALMSMVGALTLACWLFFRVGKFIESDQRAEPC